MFVVSTGICHVESCVNEVEANGADKRTAKRSTGKKEARCNMMSFCAILEADSFAQDSRGRWRHQNPTKTRTFK